MAITIPIITDFNSKGIDSATRQFQKLETTGQKAAFAVHKAAVPAGIALVALAAGAIDAANAAITDQAAQDQLSRSLDKTTNASDGAIKSVDSWITATSNATAVADDELRPALAKLARGTGDLAQAQQGLKIALDISAATGRPLGAVSDALSKAYAGNATALGKLDPHVKAMIKNGASADEVIAAMAGRFKGDAAASADTAAGKMKGLGIAVDETKEAIGGALMPIVEAVLPVLQKLGKWAQEHSTVFVILAGAIAVVAAAIIGTNIALAILALNPVVLTIMAIVLAVGLLAVGFKMLWDRSETFRDIVTGAWEKVQDVIGVVVDFLKGPVMAAWDIIKGAFNMIKGIITGDFSAAWDGLKTMIGGVVEWVKTTMLELPGKILSAAISLGTAIVNGIVSGLATLGEMAWDGIKGLAAYLVTKVPEWLADLARLGGQVITFIVSGVGSLGAAVWEKIQGFPGALWESFLTVADTIKEWGGKIIGWIVSTAGTLAADFWEKVQNFPSVVWDKLVGLKDKFEEWGKNMVRWIVSGIGSLGNAIGEALFGGIDSGGGGGGKLGPGGRDGNPATPFPMATGGIVTRPTLALIGEAGPEAVIPLNRAGASGLGGGVTINVQAGLVSTPDQIGQQIIEAIQNAQRRSGPVFAAA